MNNIDQIKTHLEYLGYTIDQSENDEQVFSASRPGYTTFMVLVNDTRVWFYTYYEINRIAKCNIDKVFKYVNDLNSSSSVVTFSINDNQLRMSTNYTGNYDRSKFTEFLSQIEIDVNDLLANTNETDLYLGDPDQAEHYLQDNSSNVAWA